MTKGDIILTPFIFTDLSTQKVRPALVLYAQKAGEDCIAAFISTQKEKLGPYGLVLEPTATNGLKTQSIVKLERLATVERKIVFGTLGTLESSIMIEVDKKLKKLFQL